MSYRVSLTMIQPKLKTSLQFLDGFASYTPSAMTSFSRPEIFSLVGYETDADPEGWQGPLSGFPALCTSGSWGSLWAYRSNLLYECWHLGSPWKGPQPPWSLSGSDPVMKKLWKRWSSNTSLKNNWAINIKVNVPLFFFFRRHLPRVV